MKNRIPCEIIRDLLPSYIDELTSEQTNTIVKEHLISCKECRETAKRMGKAEEIITEEDEREIDFLKKSKKKTKKIVFISAIMLLFISFFVWQNYFLSFPCPYDFMNVDLDIKENEVKIDGNLWLEDRGVRNVEFYEENGVITITINETKESFISPNHFFGEYTARQNIEEVWIATKIVWANGVKIDKETSNIYTSKWPYIGDATHMSRVIIESGLDDLIGDYTLALHTEKMPYGITIRTDRQFSKDINSNIVLRLKQYSSLLIGAIDNLNYITYQYYVNGEEISLTLTEDDVNKFIGKSVKEQFESADKVQEMMISMGMVN